MLKVVLLWLSIFALAASALEVASQYLIAPIWLANVIAAVYSIRLRRYLKNYVYILSLSGSAIFCASLIFDQHQTFIEQLLLSLLSGLQVAAFVFAYYAVIKNIYRFNYKRTVLLAFPSIFSALIGGLLFIFIPTDGLKYMIFFDYFLEQMATGLSIVCILYGLSEYKKVSLFDYTILGITLLAQYSISISQLFYNCFIIPLVNVYFTIHYHFKRFIFVMGILSFLCCLYLTLPLSGQYWNMNYAQLFAHLSTYRVGISSFIVVFLILSELQMQHRALSCSLEKTSFYDELTNLKNRRFLREKLLSPQAKLIKGGAVLLIDIDDFKKINDQYGHQIGDEVIKKVAQYIQSSIKTENFIFRWGGEEFLIILPEISNPIALREQSQQIIHQCKSILQIQDLHIPCSVSMGVKPFDQLTMQNYHILIEAADIMLYQAKYHGKARYMLDEDRN